MLSYLKDCKLKGYKIVGLEQTGSSKPLFSLSKGNDSHRRSISNVSNNDSKASEYIDREDASNSANNQDCIKDVTSPSQSPSSPLAAAPSSSSTSITTAVPAYLPARCVLVLGKEKEGIPVEILQEVDECIEIPQFGVTRSLNVHVSAALALWEITKQNVSFLSQYENKIG